MSTSPECPKPQTHETIGKAVTSMNRLKRNGRAVLESQSIDGYWYCTKISNCNFFLLNTPKLLYYRDLLLRLANPFPGAVPDKHTDVLGCGGSSCIREARLIPTSLYKCLSVLHSLTATSSMHALPLQRTQSQLIAPTAGAHSGL